MGQRLGFTSAIFLFCRKREAIPGRKLDIEISNRARNNHHTILADIGVIDAAHNNEANECWPQHTQNNPNLCS
jgi:hypothetical protein